MEYAHAADKAIKVNISAWDAIWSASPVVQLTLLILILASLYSWTVIFAKKKQLKIAKEENEKFADFFWEARSFEAVARDLKKYEEANLSRVFLNGYKELQKIVDNTKSGTTPKITEGDLDSVSRALRVASDRELNELEGKLNFLATTGSTGPFIGLFGTVWGIMSSFQKIGQTGSANLAVVAPGISEALIATAVGLAAAIPAVVFYNHFNKQVADLEMDFNHFSSDFLNVIKRNFVQD